MSIRNYNLNMENGGEEDDCNSDSESMASNSDITENEIPIWIGGEQRWISGVSEQTTCSDLIEALLCDEETFGNDGKMVKSENFVIIERWRKVEQILENDTKIWKIWTAWGEMQNEVRLTLHCIESSIRRQRDGDSGCASPTGSINSAIERRKRHKASKTTSAWLTQAQTIHPKSKKATIEKLMKLILEQGETIQQQISKLRDKELQISKIEEERHRIREKEHGKNYLLETYLNGLQDPNDEKDATNGNSDSGVHTEDTTTTATSPEIEVIAMHSNETTEKDYNSRIFGKKKSKREQNLFKEHENIKSNLNHETSNDTEDESSDELSSKIEALEKLVSINKKLQREEELLLRLTVKIRRYEYENPSLTENDIKNELERLNVEIDRTSSESIKAEKEIEVYDEILKKKMNLLEQLKDELDHDDKCDDLITNHPSIDYQLTGHSSNFFMEEKEEMYVSRQTSDIQKSNYEYVQSIVLSSHPQVSNLTEAQIHSIPKNYQIEPQQYFNSNYNLASNINNSNNNKIDYLGKIDQRNFTLNDNFYMNPNLKLDKKKLLINNTNFNGGCDSNSDTGLSSMGEGDISQLGTLV